MALSKIGSAGLASGAVEAADIADGAITSAKLASGAAVSNIGYTPANQSNVMGRNRIINGAMMVDQRNSGASVSTSGNTYPVDRYKLQSVTSVSTMGQSTTAPPGFLNSILYTVGTGASPAAGDANRIYHQIEGLNVYDLAWGTADAKAVTLSFWVRCSVTGTYAVGFYGAGASVYSYITTYTISSADTWTYVTLTIPGPTVGTWPTTNTVSININWDLGTGSTYQGTAGSWAAGTVWATSGATKLVQTTGATFYLTGAQLEVGSTATEFERRPYGTELALCQRYYVNMGTYSVYCCFIDSNTSNRVAGNFSFPVTMRTSPTITKTNYVYFSSQISQSICPSAAGFMFNQDVAGGRAGAGDYYSISMSAEL